MNLCQKSDKPEVTKKAESFKMWGTVIMWWTKSAPPPGEIGLRDLPKSWGIAPPNPLPTCLQGSGSPEVTEKTESLTRSKIDFL